MRALGIDIGGSSVKACLIDADAVRTAHSAGYARPSREDLAAAIREALAGLGQIPGGRGLPVGLCAPGRRSGDGESIEYALNLPCLNGWAFADMLDQAMGRRPRRWRVCSDAEAAAIDYANAHAISGRAAAIVIGTGVGLCVLDDGAPVGIGGRGVGHLGSVDVGRLGESDTIAPDGASNTLESYVGVPALRERFPGESNEQLGRRLGELPMGDPFMTAVVRAARLVHAIYTPGAIVLMGGVGMALRARGRELTETIGSGLTSLARPGWTLRFGDSLFHAASGAARLAADSG